MSQKRHLAKKGKKHVKDFLIKKYGYECGYCGIDLHNKLQTLDHIHSLSHGGSDELSNLVIVCEFCNRAKGDMELKDYYKWFNHIRSKNFKSRINL